MAEKEYIEREAALKALAAGRGCGNICSQSINRIPAADVQEVRHGEWVRTSVDGLWECSLCHGEMVVDAYGDVHPLDDCGLIGCPYCLAKMDGKGDA